MVDQVGLVWYMIAIAPLVRSGEHLASTEGEYSHGVWLWDAAEQEGAPFPAGDLYICSLYWASPLAYNTPSTAGCNPTHPRLQPYAAEAATFTHPRLQPYVPEAANFTHPRLQP